MAPNYKIALIQLHPKVLPPPPGRPLHQILLSSTNPAEQPPAKKPLSPPSNFARAAAFIAQAASEGAHLAVLPEYHLTNWLPTDPTFRSLCASSSPLYLQKYKDLALHHRICIVPGTLVEVHPDTEAATERLVNVCYFIDHTGAVLGRYEKKNLWHPERPHLTTTTPHTPHTPFPTPLGLTGLLICWDLAFPEAFRELIASGAKLIIIPTFWTLSDCTPAARALNPLAERLFLETVLTARAFENTCCVVFVNAGGRRGAEGGDYAGLSRVAMPFLGAVGGETVESGVEGMSVVEVDMGVLEEAERNYKVREDMAGEGWHYRYRHQVPKL